MHHAQCPVCGETKFDGWTYCPACGHPYPSKDDDPYDEYGDDDD